MAQAASSEQAAVVKHDWLIGVIILTAATTLAVLILKMN